MVRRYGKSERKRCENSPNISQDNIKMNVTRTYFFWGGGG